MLNTPETKSGPKFGRRGLLASAVGAAGTVAVAKTASGARREDPGFFGTVVRSSETSLDLKVDDTGETLTVQLVAGGVLSPWARPEPRPGLSVFEVGERVTAMGDRRGQNVRATSVALVADVDPNVTVLAVTETAIDTAKGRLALPRRRSQLARGEKMNRELAEPLAEPNLVGREVLVATRRSANGPVAVLVSTGLRQD